MKPNIVLLLTDDQDERSPGLVPGVEEAIGAAGGTGPGATFDRAFACTGALPHLLRRGGRRPLRRPQGAPGAVLGRLGRGRPAVREEPSPLTAEEARNADTHDRKKARSILAIRSAIVDIVKRFEEKGQLDNTYFVFTSDNGYRHGEHAMVHGKLTPHEEDLNVPLFVRGPDVSKGARLPNLALNTDRAPTFCEWAGISRRPYMDGRSLAPLSAGDKELHDIREDPYQLNNLTDDGRPPHISGSASRR